MRFLLEGYAPVIATWGRRLCRRVVAAPLLLLLLALVAQAAGPKLEEVRGSELLKTYQAGKDYTLRLEYTDPNGDPIKKSDALFIDEAPSGRISTPATAVDGSDTSKGVTLVWNIRGFEQSSHKGHFEVKALTGTTTYPQDPKEFYEFVVEALGTKYITLAFGALIGFVGVPWVTYFFARMLNPRGDPSRAARVGLLFGILAFCALFIYLFLSFYGPLVYAILILGFLAAIILLFGRR